MTERLNFKSAGAVPPQARRRLERDASARAELCNLGVYVGVDTDAEHFLKAYQRGEQWAVDAALASRLCGND